MAKEQGLSLLDIGVPTEQIMIGNRPLRVTGIAAEDVFALFQRFPEVQALIGGRVKLSDLATTAPEALSAVIAAGSGNPGDEAAEAIARRLPVEAQLDILEAIGRLTFKSGFGPFVERVIVLANVVASANFGRAPDMNSPPQSKPSLPPDSTTEPSGP